MRVLILGGDGMLGHQLLKHFAANHETRVTLRQELAAYASYKLFDRSNSYDSVDVHNLSSLNEVMADFKPDAVINAIGIVKQRNVPNLNILTIEINALLPHRLAQLCHVARARLIHISTDCVFSGRTGNYVENDPPEPDDLYGRSKLLGEVAGAHCVTLRTSIIGRELARKTGLLEWALSQTGTINGFTNAIYTGFTTLEMSRIIEKILVERPDASGIYHVSSNPTSKFDLLVLIKNKLQLPISVRPDGNFKCDRSLNSARFRHEFNYNPPSWENMIEELAASPQEDVR
jgi:dTDP-4-dehydrorhamnose reductase